MRRDLGRGDAAASATISGSARWRAASASAASPRLAGTVASASSGVDAPRPAGGLDRGEHFRHGHALAAADPRDPHGFTQVHCVTGIAGRQPVMPPSGSARAMPIVG